MAKDKVLLQGMVFYGYHGVHQSEKELGQRFVVDLEMVGDLSEAVRKDDRALTLDYSAAYDIARQVVEGPSRNLIETVAEEIAARILRALPAREVTIRVSKPAAPIRGASSVTPAVEITRTQQGGVARI